MLLELKNMNTIWSRCLPPRSKDNPIYIFKFNNKTNENPLFPYSYTQKVISHPTTFNGVMHTILKHHTKHIGASMHGYQIHWITPIGEGAVGIHPAEIQDLIVVVRHLYTLIILWKLTICRVTEASNHSTDITSLHHLYTRRCGHHQPVWKHHRTVHHMLGQFAKPKETISSTTDTCILRQPMRWHHPMQRVAHSIVLERLISKREAVLTGTSTPPTVKAQSPHHKP